MASRPIIRDCSIIQVGKHWDMLHRFVSSKKIQTLGLEEAKTKLSVMQRVVVPSIKVGRMDMMSLTSCRWLEQTDLVASVAFLAMFLRKATLFRFQHQTEISRFFKVPKQWPRTPNDLSMLGNSEKE